MANVYGVKGGIEGGFMSTTTDEKTARFYAEGGADKSKQGRPAILLETQMGMVDRGADVAWLSEFPREAEVSRCCALLHSHFLTCDGFTRAASQILFAPLTGMEVRRSRVEGAVQVYEVVLTANMATQTLEQVVSRRRKLLQDMGESMCLDIKASQI